MVVYREWKEALADLTPEERCAAWEAIMDYAFDGTVPEDKFLKVLTAMMRTRIDKDQSHYDKTCTKRAEAGRLGGLKSGEARSKRKQSEANGSNASSGEAFASFASSNEANEASGSKRKQNEHDNDYDNDNDILPSLREDEYIRAAEKILNDWIAQNQITLHSFCKNNHLSFEELKDLGRQVIVDWLLGGWKANGFAPGTGEWSATHFQNAIRSKKNILSKQESNASQQQDRLQRRRSTDATAWTEEKFAKPF